MAADTINNELIQTKASRQLARKQKSIDFKVTTFTERKNPSKTPKEIQSTGTSSDKLANNVFDMKRARHEVLHFGTNGLDSESKAIANIALAIKLGAKPPKNPKRNYKEILAEGKQRKDDKRDKERLQQLGKNAQGSASVTFKKIQKAKLKKKLNGQISKHYGVVNPKIQQKKNKKSL